MKKLTGLFTVFAIAAVLSMAGCSTGSSSTPVVPVTHMVAFDANGGTAVASQTVEDGQLATEPTTTNGSHNLVGWYTGSVKYDFASKVTSDLALTAKWTTTSTLTAKYKSSTTFTKYGQPYTLSGYVSLDYTTGKFTNFKSNGEEESTGTFTKVENVYTFTILTSQTSSYVDKVVSYTELNGTWTQDPVVTAALYGFGNNLDQSTDVTMIDITTAEVE